MGFKYVQEFPKKKIDLQKKNTQPKYKLFSIAKILFIASIPSIVGFISFIPTDYVGLSELGIISAIGLMVGLILNIIFLPSLIKIVFNNMEINFLTYKKLNLMNFIFRFQKSIIVLLILISIFSFINIKKIQFDSDALNLKDQNLQSVKLAKKLMFLTQHLTT